MDNSYRIPGQSSPSQTRTGGSLPAPGSVIMANVEDDLGDGLYALRWSGQRIAVASQVVLKRGQSLILRSEKSPEGKSLLVVQGPALPEKGAVTGRVIYGPGNKNQGISHNSANTAQAPQTNQGGGSQGGPIAAGTMPAGQAQTFGPVRELVGLILEPQPGADFSVDDLLQAAEEEKGRLQSDQGKSEAEKADQEAPEEKKAAKPETADASRQEKPVARPGEPVVQTRPAAPVPGKTAGQTTQAGQAGQPGQSAQPGQTAAVQVPPGKTPSQAGPATPSSPSPSSPQPPVNPPTASPMPDATPVPIPRSGQTAPSAAVVDVLAGDAGPSVPESPISTAQQTASRQETSPTPGQTNQTPPPQSSSSQPSPAQPSSPQSQPPPPSQQAQQVPLPQATSETNPSQAPASTSQTPQPAAAETPTASGQPELYSKEALSQMVRTSELPLDSATKSLGTVGAMPDSVVDKAAGILLRAAGLQPDSLAMDAARALVRNNQPVDRDTVQALISVAGGLPPEEQDAVIRAAARLAGKDIPISPPLVAGLADVLDRRASVSTLMGQARDALQLPAGEAGLPAEVRPLLSSAGELLDLLHVDLDSADAPQALERFVSTFGREALGRTLALVEKAASLALQDNPTLQNIDAALSEIYALLEEDMAATVKNPGQTPGSPTSDAAQQKPPAAGTPQPGTTMTPGATGQTAPATEGEQPPPAPPTTPAPAPQTPASSQPPILPETPPGKVPLPATVPGREIPEMEVVQERPAISGEPVPGQENQAKQPVPGTPAPPRESAPPAGAPGPTPIPAGTDPSAGQAVADLSPEMKKAAELLASITKNAASTAATAGTLGRDNSSAPTQGPHATQPPAAAEPPRRPAAINAYLNAPKAFNLAEALRNLPPMPKVARLDAPVAELPTPPAETHTPTQPAAQPSPQVNGAEIAKTIIQNLPASLPPGETLPVVPGAPAIPGVTPGAIPAIPIPEIPVISMPTARPDGSVPTGFEAPAADGQDPFLPSGQAGSTSVGKLVDGLPASLLANDESGVLNRLDSLFQIPGLNRPETELLRPAGFLDQYLGKPPDMADAARIKSEADSLFRQLTSENSETVRKAMEELKEKEPAILRETASRLGEREQATVRSDPLLGKLADAASSLRDLGRQLLAVKAENLAGQDRTPGVMLAEVPLKFGDDTGDGRMQMFYRRSKGKGDGWTQRVILDLNTTQLGPVLGDMRFFNQDMILNMFVERHDLASYLETASEQLVDGLWVKGFRVKARFMVLPTPPAVAAERSDMQAETDGTGRDGRESAGEQSKTGTRRLDIKG